MAHLGLHESKVLNKVFGDKYEILGKCVFNWNDCFLNIGHDFGFYELEHNHPFKAKCFSGLQIMLFYLFLVVLTNKSIWIVLFINFSTNLN